MKFTPLTFISLISPIISIYYPDNKKDKTFTLTNFTFGSGFYGLYSTNLTIFSSILNHNSNLWLWLGDAAYISKPHYLDYFKSTFPLNWTQVEFLFSQTKNNIYYSKLRQSTKIIGIWNDQDYGVNDGNGNNANKEKIKQYYLDFLDVPSNNPLRKIGRGIYTSYSFGKGYKTVRIILLDVRYYKSGYIFNMNDDMLGEDQWNWLENILKYEKETYTFICSPTQILPFNKLVNEAWYKNSRKRLFELIGKYKKEGVILLTGDGYCGKVYKTFCVLPEIGYDLYELSSNGMSNYNKESGYLNKMIPNDYDYGKGFYGYNFGEVKIDWGNNKEKSKVVLSIYDINDKEQVNVVLPYEMLRYKKRDLKESRESIFVSSCEMRINRRFKTIYEIYYYYIHHRKEIPIIFMIIGVILLLCQIFTKIKRIQIFLGVGILFIACIAKYIEVKERKQYEQLFQ